MLNLANVPSVDERVKELSFSWLLEARKRSSEFMSYHSIRDQVDEPILKGLRSNALLDKADRLRNDVCYKRLKLDPEQMRAAVIGESRS